MDVGRDWESIRRTGRQNLLRAWQNGRLWWNDPDCVVHSGSTPPNEAFYHFAVAFVTGGLLICGDDVTAKDYRNEMGTWLRRYWYRSPNRSAEVSEDGTVARMTVGEATLVFFFNPTDAEIRCRIPEDLLTPTQRESPVYSIAIQPHSARPYVVSDGKVVLFHGLFDPR